MTGSALQGDGRFIIVLANVSKGSTNEYWQTLSFQLIAVEHIPPHDAFRLFDESSCSVLSQCTHERCVGTYWSREDVAFATPSEIALHFSGFEVATACNGSNPQINAEGELKLAPARDQHGVAIYDVIVTDDGGTAHGGQNAMSAPLIIKVVPQPRVWGVSPRLGPASGNNLVTIQGQYFGSMYSRGYVDNNYRFSSVSVGGVECLEHKYLSDSQILCRCAPACSRGPSAVD